MYVNKNENYLDLSEKRTYENYNYLIKAIDLFFDAQIIFNSLSQNDNDISE